ncbi:hypothetical protein J4573_16315 [Actinomadura barringtoniae]|uniref:Uncharacterized protein n=1 Tax=Actinomadura barringtoniae TaxID=1427535 RepID=A0A939PAN7_9ACTN|nr:hypothetical protein [Actinomadura barringtoniae]MBO2448667.1 hypothetical protein [Actinomadura barringtoniae]
MDSSFASEWPEARRQQSTTLFRGRHEPPLRKLVVLVDVDVLSQEGELSAGWQLSGVIEHGYIRCYRYADQGPPVDADWQLCGPGSEERFAVGWAMPPERDNDGGWSFIYAHEDRASYTGFSGSVVETARRDAGSTSYSNLPPEAAAQQREADTLAVLVADQAHADIFITNRPYLFESKRHSYSNLTVCRPEEALALIGLYLRAQGERVIPLAPVGGHYLRLEGGLYSWVGARELLPSAWRWYTACVQHASAAGDDSLLYLGGSALQRVQRALEHRDNVHCSLNQIQDGVTLEAALSSFEVALILLLGAVDATARVAHTVLGISGKTRDAGWQSPGWLSKVGTSAPALAAIFASGTDEQCTLTILRLLRNTVHGEALRGMRVQSSSAERKTLFGIPRDDESILRASFAALGGEESWGVEQLHRGFHADPGVLLEALFPRVIALLNLVMDETPVEHLSHVVLKPAHMLPPEDRPLGPFHERTRRSVRLQLGI